MTDQEAYDELSFYTLTHPDPAFIHQFAVDAFAAQTADPNPKPIKIAFALAGLYLHLERNYTGREVQLAHVELSKMKDRLPRFELPLERGVFTVRDALAAPPGQPRDEAITEWSRQV